MSSTKTEKIDNGLDQSGNSDEVMKQSLSEDDGYSSSVVKGQFPDAIDGSRDSMKESRDTKQSREHTTSSELDTINRPQAEHEFESEVIRENSGMMTSSSLQNLQTNRIFDKAVNKLENQHFIQQHLLQKQLEIWVCHFLFGFSATNLYI